MLSMIGIQLTSLIQQMMKHLLCIVSIWIKLRDWSKFYVVKSDKSLYVVKCVDDDSQWRLWAAKISMSEFFSIRTYIITHTCGIEKQKKKHSQATAAVVADMVKTR